MSGGTVFPPLNWRQEVAAATVAIAGLNNNAATLKIVLASDAGFYYGEASAGPVVERDLVTKFPAPVRERLIDDENYVAGDRTVVVDYAQMRAAFTVKADDPVPDWTGSRPFDEAHHWGLVPGRDRFAIGKAQWTIARVEAFGMLRNAPAKFRLVLRK